MGKILRGATVLALAISVGCVTTTTGHGEDFDTQGVSKIVKNKSTPKDIERLFGTPSFKYPVSGSQERWHYQYTRITQTSGGYFIPIPPEHKMESKTLDILFENGVVINYTMNDATSRPSDGPP